MILFYFFQQNLMQKPKTQPICPTTRPLILPNGIKLHLPPNNLLLGLPQPPVISPMVSEFFFY